LPHAREQIQKHHNYSLLKRTCYQSIEDPRRDILHHEHTAESGKVHPKEMCKYTHDDYKRKKKAKVDGYENFPRHCVYKTVKTPVHTRSSVVSKRSKKTSSKRFHPTARARDHQNETKTGSIHLDKIKTIHEKQQEDHSLDMEIGRVIITNVVYFLYSGSNTSSCSIQQQRIQARVIGNIKLVSMHHLYGAVGCYVDESAFHIRCVPVWIGTDEQFTT